MAFTDRYVTATGVGSYAGSTSSLTPMDWPTMLANVVAGDRINVKVGTYTRTNSSDAPAFNGTAASPIIIRGYSATPGDGYLGRGSANGNGDLVNTNMPVISYTTGRLSGTGTFCIIDSIQFQGANTGNCVTLSADSVFLRSRVIQSGTSAGSIGIALGARAMAFDSDAYLTGATGGTTAMAATAANCIADSCRVSVVSATANAINCSTSSGIYACNIFASGGHGIAMTVNSGCPFIRNNTITLNTGDGINIVTGTTTVQHIVGNMITDNTGNGINMVINTNPAISMYNRLRSNAANYANAGDWLDATKQGEVTTVGGPGTDYSNSGSHDFSLVPSSPGAEVNIQPYASMGAFQLESILTGGGGSKSVIYGA